MKQTRLFVAGLLLAAVFAASAQPTSFTYQGVLGENGVPASGQYDLLFTLRDAASAGNQIGVASSMAPVSVTNGHFTVTLDFGAAAFNGGSRWLELGVRPAGSAAAHMILSPRQPLGSAPYAIQALAAASVSGNISDSQISPNFARLNGNPVFIGTVAFNPVFGAPFSVGNSNKIARLNADYLDGLDSSSFALAAHAHGAGDITSGSLADGRLSANVALLDKGQRFTGSNTFSGVVWATNGGNLLVGSFSGSGAGLSNLNAAGLSGVLPVGSLPSSAAQLGASQTFSGAVTFAPPAGAPFRVGSATLVTNLNADLLDGVGASSFWNTGGNTNTAGAGFLGTLDNSPFELRVNNQRALRLVPGVNGGPIWTANPSVNSASAAAEYSTVAGGSGNSVQAPGSFIGGGSDNIVTGGGGSVILGGSGNRATNNFAVVAGGIFNLAGGQFSFAAGRGARATNEGTFVWGDSSTAAFVESTAPNQFLIRATGGVGIGTASPSAQLHVAGRIQADEVKLATGAAAGAVLTSDASGLAGWSQPPVRAVTNGIGVNTIAGFAANGMAAGVAGGTIAGGGSATGSNHISAGNFGTISGGLSNRVGGSYAVVGGGAGNSAAGEASGIGGGVSNVATGLSAYVGGGFSNRAAGIMSVVAGGEGNQATGSRATVAGGSMNFAEGGLAGIGGGTSNRAVGAYATVAGGLSNTNTGVAASIGGGSSNQATNTYAMVPGGFQNIAGGSYSFAAGLSAQALHASTFVWSDSSTKVPFTSTAPHQFLIRATGGVGIGGVPQDAMLDVEGNVRINDNDLFLRSSTNRGTGLGYYGGVKTFAGVAPDGPVVYGGTGGILGTTTGGGTASLYWNSQQVGIGTTAPQERLGVAGGVIIDQADHNDGTIANGLRFGNSSGEAIASKRTATGNQWGLDLYTGFTPRLSISYGGLVGIGTTSPTEVLDVIGRDPTFNLHNTGDGPLGGYVQNTYSSVQLGLFNTGAGALGQVAAGAKRAFFGLDSSGKVGSMLNTTPAPVFRNLLDDGSGNLSVLGGVTAGGSAVISGGLRVGDNDVYLRAGADLNHGFGWYGPGRPFGAYSPDGPVVYGYGGGALGTVAPGVKGVLIRNVALAWDNSLRVGVGRSATANRLEVEGEASKTTSGSWAANSDARIKTGIAGITNALETLDRVRLVSFNYSDAYRAEHPTIENHRYLNVVAQEFQLIFPDYVRGSGEQLAGGGEILQVDTYPLTIYSAAAIQELRREVGVKEERIRLLEQKNSNLEDRLAALERVVAGLQAGAGR